VIGPAPVLAVIVGRFHVSAYVFVRGRAGARLPLLIVAAILGAWAGDTLGSRLAIDPLRVGDFNLLFASFVAWLGIGLVAILAVLVPERTMDRRPTSVSTVVTRGGAKTGEPGTAGASITPESEASARP
jgi:hypothetical protein